MIDKGADINRRDQLNSTAMIKASEALLFESDEIGIKSMKFLIEQGAEVNMFDSRGQSPLLNAINAGSMEAVRILVENGAHLNVYNDGSSHNGATSIFQAAVKCRLDMVKYLHSKDADVNGGEFPDYKDSNALWAALKNKCKEVMNKILI